MKKLGLALALIIVISSVFLALNLHTPSALAQYSWTDTINVYKDVTAVYTNFRKIINNETVTVDVLVYITFTEKINLLEYYKLSANETDFIIISQGTITLSNGTYYGLGQGQNLCFTVEAKGASSLAIDDTVKVGVRVEFWSAEYRHDVAVTDVVPHKTIVCQGYSSRINVTVENQGNFTETFNVTAYANTTEIETMETTLTSGTSTTLIFTWNTTDFAKGNYTISANATIVSGEIDTIDNNYIDSTVRVNMVGDVAPVYGFVDIVDVVYVAIHYEAEKGDPDYEPIADINDDGIIDIVDIVIVAIHYEEIDP